MANMLLTNLKKQELLQKENDKWKKIEESRMNRTILIAKRAQDLNKIHKTRQRIVAIDRKQHIKESLNAYKERIKLSHSLEKHPAPINNPTRYDKILKSKVEDIQNKNNIDIQDTTNKLEAYFIDYKIETENARNRKESNIKEHVGVIKKRLAKTTEIHFRARQDESNHNDALSDQLIKKLLKNEDNLKTVKANKKKQIIEEKKNLSETIVDKKMKVRVAYKNRQKKLEEQLAEDQDRIVKIEEQLRRTKEDKLTRLKEENNKWREYFLRALEINESNVILLVNKKSDGVRSLLCG